MKRQKYHTELSKLEKKIWEIVGEEFNVSSPKQLGEMLFVKMGLKPKNQKKTASGGFSTKESELEKILKQPSVYDEFLRALDAAGFKVPAALLTRDAALVADS